MVGSNRIWIVLSWLLGIMVASISFEVYQQSTSNLRSDLQHAEELLHGARTENLHLQAVNVNLTFQLQQLCVSPDGMKATISMLEAAKTDMENIIKEQEAKITELLNQLDTKTDELQKLQSACSNSNNTEVADTVPPSCPQPEIPVANCTCPEIIEPMEQTEEPVIIQADPNVPEAPCPEIPSNFTTYNGLRTPLAVDPILYSLLEEAHIEGTVIVTTVNSAFLDYAKNWVMSLENVGIKKYLIVALDKHAYDQLKEWGYHCYFNPHYTGSEELTEWGAPAYREIVRKKSLLMAYILFQGYDMFFIDTDVVFYKNPLPYTKVIGDNDYLIQCDDANGCLTKPTPTTHWWMNTGVVFLKSNWKTVSFISLVAEHQNVSGYTQQTTWNELAQLGGYKSVKYDYFDPLKFANGLVFYRTHTTQRNGSEIVLAHNNWIMGSNKIYRFREYNQWFVDPVAYYTTPTRFLTYDVDLCAVTWDQERDMLAAAVGLAIKVNRTIILPQFACRSQDLPQVREIIKRYPQDTMNCSMDDTFDARAFFETFGNNAREHSFLTNFRTPKVVKEDVVDVWISGPDSQPCPHVTESTKVIHAQNITDIIEQVHTINSVTRIHLVCHDWKNYLGFMDMPELFDKLKKGVTVEGLFYGGNMNPEYHMFRPDLLTENRRVAETFKNTERCKNETSS